MKVKFYRTQSGRSPVLDFLDGVSGEIKSEFLDAILLLEEGTGLTMPLSRNLSSIYRGLHELRLRDRSGSYRFFYFIKKADGIYFIHALLKKSQELPPSEIRLILKRLKEV